MLYNIYLLSSMNKIKEIDSNLFEQPDKNYLWVRTLATINQKTTTFSKLRKVSRMLYGI